MSPKLEGAALVDAVRVMMTGGLGSESLDDELMGRIKASVPSPHVSDLIFWSKRSMTAEEIVEEALAYKAIQL